MGATSSTTRVRSRDGRDLTFVRAGTEARIAAFVRRVREGIPSLAAKLPADLEGVEALASAGWLDREDYQGPLRADAFALLERGHFVQDLSSGTTGEPVLRFNTWSDELSEQLLTRRVFALAGLAPEDRVVCLEIGAPEISAFYFRAMAELGVRDRAFLHVSTDFLGSIEPLERIDPTVILTVPGILARSAPRFFEMYDGKRTRALRRVIAYAEPVSEALRARLGEVGVECFSFYGTTEIGGLAGECRAHAGLHVQDDWVVPTLRDAVEVEPGVFDGEVGWTAMHFEAQPTVKYAVGDHVRIDTRPCPCGEPGVRMSFLRRNFDVVSIYGLKFGFGSIERALKKALGTEEPLVQLVLSDAPGGMAMTVRVCRDHPFDEQAVREALYEVFELDEMIDMGYLTLSVEAADRSEFGGRKLRRVVDERSASPF